MRRSILRLVIVLAVASALLAALLPWDGARLLAAAPLAFVLPGFAIIAASFGQRRPEPRELVVLTLGASVSVLALGGLALNYAPGGIGTASWAILLAAVTVAASVVADRRGFELERRRRGRRRVGWANAACVVVALGLAAGGVALVSKPLPADSAAGFTALWMLPPSDGGAGQIKVGVESFERTRRAFRLQLRVGEGSEDELGSFTLQPGGRRVFETTVVDRPADRSLRVTALLFRQSDPGKIYRKVRVWLPAEET